MVLASRRRLQSGVRTLVATIREDNINMKQYMGQNEVRCRKWHLGGGSWLRMEHEMNMDQYCWATKWSKKSDGRERRQMIKTLPGGNDA